MSIIYQLISLINKTTQQKNSRKMENEMNIDKIIEKSKQWTLEGDCTLLQWMNQISNNLEERVTKTSSDINQMSIKLDRTSVALSNVTNNLAALQYSKFVENRVQEDDETLASTANVPSEDVPDSKNKVQDIYTFLKKNIEMMNSCHEAYSISYEDSDDDEDDEPVTSVVYRSKNPYEARPLPHIYGSTLWKEKWHIGLCDSDNDFSGEENSEQFSESSSTADDSYESTAPTMSEWDSTAWGLNTQQNVDRKNMHSPSNDGESSYQGEDYSQSKVSTPRAQRQVPITAQQPIQDQRYYQHIPRRQEGLFDDIFDDSKPQEVVGVVVPAQVVPAQVVSPPQVVAAPQKKTIPESYIPNEPPPDDQSIESENNRRVGAKKTLNLFDDDEFSSFMDQIVQKATNKNTKPNEQSQKNSEPPKKTMAPNLFNDHVPPVDDSQAQPKRTLASNLFDESNVQKQKHSSKPLRDNLFSDPDDLFGDTTAEKTQEPPKKVIAANLFNDSDDLFTTPSIKEQPIFKINSSLPKLEEDVFTSSQTQSASTIGKTKIKNLFDDDDDEDDDFDNIFSSKPSTSSTFSQATKNLFSDDLAVEPDNSKNDDESMEKVPTNGTGLLNEEKNNIAKENEKATKMPLLKDTPDVQKNIFDDDRSAIIEPKISSGTAVLKEDTFKVSSLLKKSLFDDFDDLEDENDIFSSKPAKKDSFENLFKKEKSDNKLSTFESKTLFDDKDEKEIDNKLATIQTKTLFGDEDAKEITKSIESEKSEAVEVVQEKDKNKHSEKGDIPNFSSDSLRNAPSNEIFVPSSSIKKTQVDDIFSDNVPDDFENFISSNKSKPHEVNEEISKLPEPSTNPAPSPVIEVNPTESKTTAITPTNLPIIAQKPMVDKSSKPQSKIVPKKDIKDNLTENTQEQEIPTMSTTKQEEVKISPSPSKSHRLTVENPKTHFSEIDPNIDDKDFVATEEQIKDTLNKTEEENILNKVTSKSDKEFLKGTSKPKPKVIIEDENKSFSEEITNEKSFGNQSAKKPSTIPSYTSLFHDDIPPEDENPQPFSNEESPLHHTADEEVEVKPISSSSSIPYNSINLFADVPPDDYFSASTSPPPSVVQTTKRIHSIFYDDFNETIEAGREKRTPPSYMINDEPPPDDKDNKPTISEVKKDKPQISKLKKMDFQINVGALLPSAKLPSFKKPEAVEKSPSEILTNEQNTPNVKSNVENDNVPIQISSVRERELPENILPNLNKDRAKVQVKRRPSTRTGRQERYRKSMIEETVSIVNEDENEIEIKKSISSSTSEGFQHERKEKQNINEIKAQTLSSPSEDKKKEIIKETKEALPDPAALFEESDNFFNKNVTSKATTTKIPSLFQNSDSESDNFFETLKTTKSNTTKSELEPSPATKNFDSLFDSDGIDENPFGTPKNFLPPSITVPKEMIKPPLEEKSKLDILFETVQPTKESKLQQEFKTAFKPSAEESAKSTPKSLFGDSDDDNSDDLFKGARVSKKSVTHTKTEQKPKTKPSKPSASLFSSDEGSGSGDDIFGKSKPKSSTKKNVPTVKDKGSKNLFADISDDDSDDLFGTSIKVNKSKTNPPKNKVQSTKQPAQAQQAKEISKNPLSDLLGP